MSSNYTDEEWADITKKAQYEALVRVFYDNYSKICEAHLNKTEFWQSMEKWLKRVDDNE